MNKVDSPLVSVITAVYNSSKYLPQNIESILNQTYPNIELILIDDGSKDSSKDIIRNYAKKNKRIKYIFNKVNSGQAVTRNNGISMAKGKYIAISDSDDISLPNRIERQVSYLEKHNEVDILGSNFYVFTNDDDPLVKGEIHSDAIKKARAPIHNPTCILRKSVIDKYGGYNPRFNNAEDHEMFLRYYSKGLIMKNVNDYLVKYRVMHGTNNSNLREAIVVSQLIKTNLVGLFKYKIRYSIEGYLTIVNQIIYLIAIKTGLVTLKKNLLRK